MSAAEAEMEETPPQNIGSEEGTEEVAAAAKAPLWVHAVYFIVSTLLLVFCIIMISKIVKKNRKIREQKQHLQTDIGFAIHSVSQVAADVNDQFYYNMINGNVTTNGRLYAYNSLNTEQGDWFGDAVHAVATGVNVFSYKTFAEALNHTDCFGTAKTDNSPAFDAMAVKYGQVEAAAKDGGVAGKYAKDPCGGQDDCDLDKQADEITKDATGVDRDSKTRWMDTPKKDAEGTDIDYEESGGIKKDESWQKCGNQLRAAQKTIASKATELLGKSSFKVGSDILKLYQAAYEKKWTTDHESDDKPAAMPEGYWGLAMAALNAEEARTGEAPALNLELEEADQKKVKQAATDLVTNLGKALYAYRLQQDKDNYQALETQAKAKAACTVKEGEALTNCNKDADREFGKKKYEIKKKSVADLRKKLTELVGGVAPKQEDFFDTLQATADGEDTINQEHQGGWSNVAIDDDGTEPKPDDPKKPTEKVIEGTGQDAANDKRQYIGEADWLVKVGFLENDPDDISDKPKQITSGDKIELYGKKMKQEALTSMRDAMIREGTEKYIPSSVTSGPGGKDVQLQDVVDAIKYSADTKAMDEKDLEEADKADQEAITDLNYDGAIAEKDDAEVDKKIKKKREELKQRKDRYGMNPTKKVVSDAFDAQRKNRMQIETKATRMKVETAQVASQAAIAAKKIEQTNATAEQEKVDNKDYGDDTEGEKKAKDAAKKVVDDLQAELEVLENYAAFLKQQVEICNMLSNDKAEMKKKRQKIQKEMTDVRRVASNQASPKVEKFVGYLRGLQRKIIIMYADIFVNQAQELSSEDKKNPKVSITRIADTFKEIYQYMDRNRTLEDGKRTEPEFKGAYTRTAAQAVNTMDNDDELGEVAFMTADPCRRETSSSRSIECFDLADVLDSDRTTPYAWSEEVLKKAGKVLDEGGYDKLDLTVGTNDRSGVGYDVTFARYYQAMAVKVAFDRGVALSDWGMAKRADTLQADFAEFGVDQSKRGLYRMDQDIDYNRFYRGLTKPHAETVVKAVKKLEKIIDDMHEVRSRVLKTTAEAYDRVAEKFQGVLKKDKQFGAYTLLETEFRQATQLVYSKRQQACEVDANQFFQNMTKTKTAADDQNLMNRYQDCMTVGDPKATGFADAIGGGSRAATIDPDAKKKGDEAQEKAIAEFWKSNKQIKKDQATPLPGGKSAKEQIKALEQVIAEFLPTNSTSNIAKIYRPNAALNGMETLGSLARKFAKTDAKADKTGALIDEPLAKVVTDNLDAAKKLATELITALLNYVGQLHGATTDNPITLPTHEDTLAKYIIDESNDQFMQQPDKDAIDAMIQGKSMQGVLNLALGGYKVDEKSFKKPVDAIAKAKEWQKRGVKSRVRRYYALQFLSDDAEKEKVGKKAGKKTGSMFIPVNSDGGATVGKVELRRNGIFADNEFQLGDDPMKDTEVKETIEEAAKTYLLEEICDLKADPKVCASASDPDLLDLQQAVDNAKNGAFSAATEYKVLSAKEIADLVVNVKATGNQAWGDRFRFALAYVDGAKPVVGGSPIPGDNDIELLAKKPFIYPKQAEANKQVKTGNDEADKQREDIKNRMERQTLIIAKEKSALTGPMYKGMVKVKQETVDAFNKLIKEQTARWVTRYEFQQRQRVKAVLGNAFSARYDGPTRAQLDATVNKDAPQFQAPFRLRTDRGDPTKYPTNNEAERTALNKAVIDALKADIAAEYAKITRRRLGVQNSSGVYRGAMDYTTSDKKYGMLIAYINTPVKMKDLVAGSTLATLKEDDLSHAAELTKAIENIWGAVTSLEAESESTDFAKLGSSLDRITSTFNTGSKSGQTCPIRSERLNKTFQVTTGLMNFGPMRTKKLFIDLVESIKKAYAAIGIAATPADDPITKQAPNVPDSTYPKPEAPVEAAPEQPKEAEAKDPEGKDETAGKPKAL